METGETVLKLNVLWLTEWIYNELQCILEFNCVLANPNTFKLFQREDFEFVVACLFLTVLRHVN